MKILFLGYEQSPVLDFLRTQGEVTNVSPTGEIPSVVCDCLVSYGYRKLVSHAVLGQYPNRAVNLHISLLPWNAGADPNFWSWWDNTPKGVSIIEMVDKLDAGRIYVQKEIIFSEDETLTSSYWKLRAEIENLFIETWATIWSITPQNQIGKESFHSVADLIALKDKIKAEHGVSIGLDMSISRLQKLGEQVKSSSE